MAEVTKTLTAEEALSNDKKDEAVYKVRTGFVLHRKRSVQTPKGTTSKVDVFDGDDPDSNEVPLTPYEAMVYAAQIEPMPEKTTKK